MLQAAQAVQLQRAGSCDALLVTAAAGKEQQQQREEEDGTGMELTQLLDRIRAQCDQSRLPDPGQRHISSGAASHLLPGLPSHTGDAAAAVGGGGGAVSEVATHSRSFTYAFILCLCHGTRARCQPDTPSPQTPDLSTTKADGCMTSAAAAA